MVLLSPSVNGLRKLIKICEEYAEVNGLSYNAKKSEFLVFRGRNKAITFTPSITLCGSPLRQVTEFRYLGHIVTERLDDDRDIERERRALSVRVNMLARRFVRCRKPIKLTLFRRAVYGPTIRGGPTALYVSSTTMCWGRCWECHDTAVPRLCLRMLVWMTSMRSCANVPLQWWAGSWTPPMLSSAHWRTGCSVLSGDAGMVYTPLFDSGKLVLRLVLILILILILNFYLCFNFVTNIG